MADSGYVNEYGSAEESDRRNERKERRDDYRGDRRDRDYDRRSRRHGDSERNRDEERRRRRRSRSRSGSRERERERDNRRSRSHRYDYSDDRPQDHDEELDYSTYDSDRRVGNSESGWGNRGQVGGNYRGDEYHQANSGERIRGQDWRSKLTSIRDAHFNRSKQAPTIAQNQFRNDGSFLEMFKKKMAEQNAKGEEQSKMTPNSLVLASSSIPFSPDLSLPPLTTSTLEETQASSSSSHDKDQDLDGEPMPTHKPLPVPVSVAKRRLAKPLKTGIVIKKPQEPEEDEASQEKLDAWARYLQEVQKYKSANCVDEDSSRPLVK